MEIIKNKFRDKIFGYEFEYIVIKNKEERILIFQYNNKINIININTVKDLLENLIECKLLSEFLKETIEEQDTYIEELETEIDLDLYNGDLEE